MPKLPKITMGISCAASIAARFGRNPCGAGCCASRLPAAARPRDDAMSAAFRCAVIGEARQWLDCYYGAAQPVRAALGMPPRAGSAGETGLPRRLRAPPRPATIRCATRLFPTRCAVTILSGREGMAELLLRGGPPGARWRWVFRPTLPTKSILPSGPVPQSAGASAAATRGKVRWLQHAHDISCV